MKRLLSLLIISVIFLLFINCNIFAASDTPNADTSAASKEVDSVKCNLYIIYPKQFWKYFCPIYVNGLLETCLKTSTYVSCNINPGKIKIAYFAETYSEIIIDAMSGENYYIQAQPTKPSFNEQMAHGGLPYCVFTVLDETEGKKLLSECTTIDWTSK